MKTKRIAIIIKSWPTTWVLLQVHGGTTNDEIVRKVTTAETDARKNMKKHGEQMYTVLFFDEANTTEAIGLIKEIMCDKSIAGKPLVLCENLKIIAACNLYRKYVIFCPVEIA